jgi:hypothetical protein
MSQASKFLPEIWHVPGVTAPILVCGSRFYHGDEIRSAMAQPPLYQKNYTFLSHAVVIQLDPVLLITGFTDRDPDRVWTCEFPEAHGISRRSAGLALAEAWRIVKVKEFDLVSRKMGIAIDLKKVTAFRNAVIPRNIFTWMHWDKWNRDGLTEKQRVEKITGAGFVCTEKAFRRLLEQAGMSI